MRGVAVLVVALTLTGCATFHTSRDDEDRWWAVDKAQHFGLSTAGAWGTTWTARAAGASDGTAATLGVSLTLSGGLIKEWWDAVTIKGSGWSARDLVWDTLGTLVGTGLGWVTPVP